MNGEAETLPAPYVAPGVPTRIDETLPSTYIEPKVPANIILWIIAAFVVIFLLWAWLTEIDRTVGRSDGSFPARNCRSFPTWKAA